MRVIGGAVFLMSVLLSNAVAQVPKGNVFIGYSYLSADLPNISGRQNLNGWDGSLEGKVLPFLGIVVDGSGHYGKTQIPTCSVPFGGSCAPVNGNLYTALIGPRVSASFGGIRPFAHVLVGAANVSGASSEFSLASAVGGGLDFKIAPILGWRFQGDYIHTHFSGAAEGHALISTGVVLRF
jgi:hypothetical protein